MIRIITIVLGFLGVFICIGTVGALDTGNISELQGILQAFLGISLFIPYGIRKVYLKHHNTIE